MILDSCNGELYRAKYCCMLYVIFITLAARLPSPFSVYAGIFVGNL